MSEAKPWFVVIGTLPAFRVVAGSYREAADQLAAVGIGRDKWDKAGLKLVPGWMLRDLAGMDPMDARYHAERAMSAQDLIEAMDDVDQLIAETEGTR